jgi:hypothetical protein
LKSARHSSIVPAAYPAVWGYLALSWSQRKTHLLQARTPFSIRRSGELPEGGAEGPTLARIGQSGAIVTRD